MITDYGQMSVKLVSLLASEEAKQAINKALSTYPLYEAKKKYDLIPTREELNAKILDHYKYREIGFETVGRFIDELRITMCEIMPYYNELFKSVEIMSDLPNPFDNVDVTETFEEERTQTTETEGKTTGSNNSTTNANATSSVSANGTTTHDGTENTNRKFSDTPQNSVSNLSNYLTEYTEEEKSNEQTDTSTSTSNGTDTSHSETTGTDSASTTGKSEGTGTTKHTFTKKGNQGVNTYAHDMNEFRTSIIDVVDRIIHDNRLAELFMLVW